MVTASLSLPKTSLFFAIVTLRLRALRQFQNTKQLVLCFATCCLVFCLIEKCIGHFNKSHHTILYHTKLRCAGGALPFPRGQQKGYHVWYKWVFLKLDNSSKNKLFRQNFLISRNFKTIEEIFLNVCLNVVPLLAIVPKVKKHSWRVGHRIFRINKHKLSKF